MKTNEATSEVENVRAFAMEDPYRYFENNGTPQVQEWLKKEAGQTECYFQNIPVRTELRDRFRALFSIDTIGTLAPRQGKYFSVSRKGDQEMGVLYVQDGISGTPRLLIDPNALSEDKSITLSDWNPSRDGRLLAYGLSKAGNDKGALYVMDVATGEKLTDFIPDDLYPSFESWAVDGSGFWYSKHDPSAPMSEAKLYQRTYFHALGSEHQNDPLIFGEHLEKEELPSVTLSEDGRYLLAQVYGQDKETAREWQEVFVRDLSDPEGAFVLVVKRLPGTRCSATIHRDVLYLISNHDAPRWHILEVKIEDSLRGSAEPRVLVPEGEGTIEETAFVGDTLFIVTLENVHSVVREYDLRGVLIREIPLPTIGSAGGFSYEREGKELFFYFESFATPHSVYRLDLATRDLKLFAKMEAGFDPDILTTEQVWFPSKDGTRIPMFLIHKKGLIRDGNNPTLSYGYGGFDISLTPSFMKSIVPFVERGGVYTIVNLRGGGERGQEWHEAGMQKNKQNVFDDFAYAIRWLITEKYTRKERVAIQGGSNGGLLTMATITQNPDLVSAAIADVPVTDMLRYHLFDGGVHWIPDYGNPDDPAMREYLLCYSPYHNVRVGKKYPAVLIATSDSDDRVHPMHSYKMVARLKEANASANPILLRVELKAGHGGASAKSKFVDRLADTWSFVFDRLGMIE